MRRSFEHIDEGLRRGLSVRFVEMMCEIVTYLPIVDFVREKKLLQKG